MPICIECCHPTETLWTRYNSNRGHSKGQQAAGDNIRLTVCKNCGKFCDKLVEFDNVHKFIKLVLIKPQVYRHLLFNELMPASGKFDPSIARLALLLLLFDIYLTWARIEKQFGAGTISDESGYGLIAKQPILLQYGFFMTLCFLGNLAFHLTIRFLTTSRYSPLVLTGLITRSNWPNQVSTALLISSFTKLFPILMIIWAYNLPAAARLLGWAGLVNNFAALKILLDCSWGPAALITIAGATVRWVVSSTFLRVVGMEEVIAVAETSMVQDGQELWGFFRNATAGQF